MMTYAGWMLMTTDADLASQILDRSMALLCEHFHLCAAAACACLTGSGDAVCRETAAGNHFRHRTSEGPSWFGSVVALENSVRIDIHMAGHLIHRELTSFQYALEHEFNLPAIRLQGSGNNHF